MILKSSENSDKGVSDKTWHDHIPLNHGSPTLLLESSNPNQTHLNQLIEVFRDT